MLMPDVGGGVEVRVHKDGSPSALAAAAGAGTVTGAALAAAVLRALGRRRRARDRARDLSGDGTGKRAPADDAEEMYIASTGPFGPATHSGTLELLARELARLAGSVPAVEDVPVHSFPRHEPTPRPVLTVKAKHEPDEWDFLEPVSVERRQPLPAMVLPPVAPSRSSQEERQAGGSCDEVVQQQILSDDATPQDYHEAA